jgi:hypothetical protein
MYKYDRQISSAIHGGRPRITLIPSRQYHYADLIHGAMGPLGVAEATATAIDPVAEFGRKLWENAPAGVAVAIYYAPDAEQTRRAIEWATRENAVGPRGRTIAAADLTFGKALADSARIVTQVTQLGAALKAAVDRIPAPSGIIPLPGTGPHLIRTLALFTHGTNTAITVGGGISTGNAADVIKSIALALTDDVKIIIYGCSAARGSRERKDAWEINTMSPGGADSLAGKLRDALVDAGKSKATVWSHTEVGHTTRNPSLRFFPAGFGKGTPGRSYADELIFGTVEKIAALGQIEQSIAALGFAIADRERFQRAAYKALRGLMYRAYVRAVINVIKGKKITNLTFRGANLPEMAPLFPLDVADIVRKHWANFWTKDLQEKTARQLIKELRLRKNP